MTGDGVYLPDGYEVGKPVYLRGDLGDANPRRDPKTDRIVDYDHVTVRAGTKGIISRTFRRDGYSYAEIDMIDSPGQKSLTTSLGDLVRIWTTVSSRLSFWERLRIT